MRDPELAAALKKPFAGQVAFFRQKLGSLVSTARWDDMWQAEHDRAFMVAGAAKADLLADLAAAVDQAIADGETLQAFRRRFSGIVERHGWHGWTGEATAKGRAWRTRVIYETNLITSYAAGRYAQLQEGGYEWWIYRHSDFVARPRPHHVALDGITRRADDPFWRTHYPPNGWGCRCRVVGARGPASIQRMGGDPDKPLPDWVGQIDQKTGAPVGIDKGFAYAPGATVADRLRAFVPRYRDELPPPCAALSCVVPGIDNGPLPEARMASADRILPDGMEPGWYVERFLSEFGATMGNIVIHVDVQGYGLAIGDDLFRARDGSLKVMKRDRMRHLLLLADTIKSPDEIWQMLERVERGRKRVRRRYVARWLIEGTDVPALTVFEWSTDLWSGVTAFTPDQASYLEKRGRLGTLVWSRIGDAGQHSDAAPRRATRPAGGSPTDGG